MSALQLLSLYFYFWLIRAFASSYVHQQHLRSWSLAFVIFIKKGREGEGKGGEGRGGEGRGGEGRGGEGRGGEGRGGEGRGGEGGKGREREGRGGKRLGGGRYHGLMLDRQEFFLARYRLVPELTSPLTNGLWIRH